MAFGDKPTRPLAPKSASGTFEANQRLAAARYKGNGYSTVPLPTRRADDIAGTAYAPIRWAIPNFVPEGVSLLAGPKSRGKSFIVLDWALAVARGGSALGCVPCEPGDVLYLALEDSERRIADRMRAILQGQAAPHGLEIATEWPTLDQGGMDRIEGWVAARENPRLAIIDVLAKVKGTQDRAKGVYDQDYATITPFHKLARDNGLPMLLVHHTNKGAADDPVMRISGTMGLSGAADTTLVLERAAGSMTGELHIRGRDVAERSVALQFDPHTGCVTLLGPAQDFRKSEERREIMRFLADINMPQTPSEIAVALGKKSTNIRYLLFKMKEVGEVSRLGNGKYYVIKSRDHVSVPD